MSEYLSAAELVDLTECRRAKEQVAWLRARRWKFEVTRLGRIRVARAYWQFRMVGSANDEPVLPVRPNFRLIRGAA